MGRTVEADEPEEEYVESRVQPEFEKSDGRWRDEKCSSKSRDGCVFVDMHGVGMWHWKGGLSASK